MNQTFKKALQGANWIAIIFQKQSGRQGVHFETKSNLCVTVFSGGEKKFWEQQAEKLRANVETLLPSLKKPEEQMQSLNEDSEAGRELRCLARLLYVGQSAEEKIL